MRSGLGMVDGEQDDAYPQHVDTDVTTLYHTPGVLNGGATTNFGHSRTEIFDATIVYIMACFVMFSAPECGCT